MSSYVFLRCLEMSRVLSCGLPRALERSARLLSEHQRRATSRRTPINHKLTIIISWNSPRCSGISHRSCSFVLKSFIAFGWKCETSPVGGLGARLPSSRRYMLCAEASEGHRKAHKAPLSIIESICNVKNVFPHFLISVYQNLYQFLYQNWYLNPINVARYLKSVRLYLNTAPIINSFRIWIVQDLGIISQVPMLKPPLLP